MGPNDVSFTFLSRVEEIELNIRDRRWQSALALSLTLPDILGGVAFPTMYKRYRDGRVMHDRLGRPARDVANQYIRWFDRHGASFFKASEEDEAPYISGRRCWQLRCEYLHQNRGFQNDPEEFPVRFHLGLNCGCSICDPDGEVDRGDGLDIRIDIEQFCLRMCRAARAYYESVKGEADFGSYLTPVLEVVSADGEAEV